MTDESKDFPKSSASPPAEKDKSLEATFRDFLDSGQQTIPNVLVVQSPSNPPSEASTKSEYFSAGYALGIAALLAGAIFAAIALGTTYAEDEIDEAVEQATEPLATEIEALKARIEQLEANQPTPSTP